MPLYALLDEHDPERITEYVRTVPGRYEDQRLAESLRYRRVDEGAQAPAEEQPHSAPVTAVRVQTQPRRRRRS